MKLEGFWWVPGLEEQQLPGTLTSVEDTFTLDLTVDSAGGSSFEGHFQNYDVIHGRVSDGQIVSLVGGYDISNGESSSGVATRKIRLRYVLTGGHMPGGIHEECFLGSTLIWSGIAGWFDNSEISQEWEEFWPPKFSLTFSSRDPIEVRYSDRTRLKFVSIVADSMSKPEISREFKFQESVATEVVSEDLQSLESYMSVVDDLSFFLSVCTTQYTEPKSINLKGDFDHFESQDERRPSILKLHFHSQRNPTAAHPVFDRQMLATRKDFGENFGSALELWKGFSEAVRPTRLLYVSSLYGGRSFIETKFLSLSQAAEVLHRKTYRGKYLDDEVFERTIDAIHGALPESLSRNEKEILKQKTNYLNEYSLAKRLKELGSSHKEVFKCAPTKFKVMVRKTVQARNYLTHYSDDGQPAELIDDLVDGCALLRLLVELELLRMCGANMAKVYEKVLSSEEFRNVAG